MMQSPQKELTRPEKSLHKKIKMDKKNNCVKVEKRNKKLKIIQEYLTTDIIGAAAKVKKVVK